jgi:hypothetical protein
VNRFFVGVDIGQSRDHTAIAIIQLIEAPLPKWEMPGQFYGPRPHQPLGPRPMYHLVHLERLPLGLTYPDIVKRIVALLTNPTLRGHADLIVDATGVGKPIVDMLREERLPTKAVAITPGDTESNDGWDFRVPKRDLVSKVQILFQGRRLLIARGLKDWPICLQELMSFKVKVDPVTAHDSYGYAREGIHDDLVLALTLACWGAKDFDHPSHPPFQFTSGLRDRMHGMAMGSAFDL